MERILILLGSYGVIPDAIAVCADRVAAALFEEAGISSDLLYFRGGAVLSRESACPGVRVMRTVVNAQERGQSGAGFLKKLAGLFLLPWFPLRSPDRIRAYRRFRSAVKRALSAERYGAVVCAFHPYETAMLLPMLRRRAPGVRRILWCLDPTSYEGMEQRGPGFMHGLYRRLYQRREKQYFAAADDVLLMECSRSHYARPRYDRFRSRMRFSDLPLLTPCAETEGAETGARGPVRLLYAGRFYGGNRNPRHLCRTLACLAKARPFAADFYTDGSEDAGLAACAAETGGMVRAHGLRPHAQIVRRMAAADVLVNFGNRGQEIVPSKLFELMGAGKKILHCCAEENDACLPYLARYPAAFVLLESEAPETAAERLSAFFDAPVKVDWQGLLQEFEKNTPEYTAGLIASCCGAGRRA